MGKRLFLVLPVLFVFSLFFVSVSEAVEYRYTVSKIGFWTQQTDEPAISQNITPTDIHVKLNDNNPNILKDVFLGEIPNGSFIGIGLYIIDSDDPSVTGSIPVWVTGSFDSRENPRTIEFNDESRNKISIHFIEYETFHQIATVENL